MGIPEEGNEFSDMVLRKELSSLRESSFAEGDANQFDGLSRGEFLGDGFGGRQRNVSTRHGARGGLRYCRSTELAITVVEVRWLMFDMLILDDVCSVGRSVGWSVGGLAVVS